MPLPKYDEWDKGEIQILHEDAHSFHSHTLAKFLLLPLLPVRAHGTKKGEYMPIYLIMLHICFVLPCLLHFPAHFFYHTRYLPSLSS